MTTEDLRALARALGRELLLAPRGECINHE